MTAEFYHHLSYIDDYYVDLSNLYVNMPNLFINLSIIQVLNSKHQ